MAGKSTSNASEYNAEVTELLSREAWQTERKKLRTLILANELIETVKWGKLCYTCNENNVIIIYCLKNYCAIGFFKGSLLTDEAGLLVAPGKHSQAMRQLRFRDMDQINTSEGVIADYIRQAIQIEKDGLKVDFSEKDNLDYPAELLEYFDNDAGYREAFNKLTPGRQRGYVLHISGAKQSATRLSRIEKSRGRVLVGKGYNER